MEQEPVSCPTRQEPARLPRDCLTRLRGGTRRGQRSAAVSAAGPAAPEAQAAAETSLRPPLVPLGAPGIDLTAMLSLTSLPCHCLALTPRRGPSRVLTRLPPPEPRGPRRKPPPRPSRKTSANEPVGRRRHRAAPAPRAPRCRARGSWAPGPGPAHGGGAVCTPGPPGTGCSGVGALHAELPTPPGLTQRLLWVSGRGTRLALGEMREAARGPRRVCACACVRMGVHACACVCGAGGGFRGGSCRPSPPHTPRRASLTPGSAGRRPPRGPRGLCPWTPGLASGEAGPWRPPSCPALSCGDLLRDGAPGSEARRGRLQPGSAQRPRGRGAVFWGGRPGREQQGAAGGLGGAGRVAKSSDGDGDRDGRAEGGCPLTTGSE